MDETLKELEEIKIMKDELYNIVFYDGIVDYEDYKKYMTKEEFDDIVRKAEHQANIYEEDWSVK